jgi:hypothetical protein
VPHVQAHLSFLARYRGRSAHVQQELMRHASLIMTTMNAYGRAMPDIKREANSEVVSMVLGKRKGEPTAPASLALTAH